MKTLHPQPPSSPISDPSSQLPWEDEGPLEDRTEKLILHSKRTARQSKKLQKKKRNTEPKGLLDLPYELVIEFLSYLRPSDVFRLSRVSKTLHGFITQETSTIVKHIICRRYQCLEKCFRYPVLLESMDPSVHSILQSEERQEIIGIHKKPYQHILPSDPNIVCTCLTCMLRWNALCLVIDFAHWQPNLEKGEPIPMIPRGTQPQWNTDLIVANAAIVSKALRSPLWHALILEVHLNSTVCSIRRHGENKGNKRRRFHMTKEDELSGTDYFLERSGPPSLDFPFHRDNYYMLEAYMPNRGWNREKETWMYVPADQHDRDVEALLKWIERRRLQGS
ncbi:hypothetical protein M501DRAFT_1003243 [Patellaria atrata CBS 101060]|uniref:F-box domain-containing protein n=1 Tax=Patellaria atrata CBS 101060 TaxID=1346257 RepID=A0A9P4VTP8_9PEZI|nr:hypothetical protein M501DRAFT_1003243 [Patellaria atrata CBS 101060]